MRRFAARLVLFLLPFGIVVGIPALLLVMSGELMSVRLAISLQRLDSSLHFGLAYSYPAKPYKLAALDRDDIDVLVIGTSRVMQLRAQHFVSPEHYYNAGGIISTPGDWRELARHLPATVRPHLVIVGVDPWFWNATWLSRNPDAPRDFFADTNVLNGVQQDWLRVWSDLSSRKFRASTLLLGHGVGIAARVHGSGFRSDGSYDYAALGAHIESPEHWDHDFANTFERIRRRAEGFEYADEVDPRAVDSLRALLNELTQRGAVVVGIIPPFAPSVLDRMESAGGYGYMKHLVTRVGPVFAERGFLLVDFGMRRFADADFIDGYHGSEKVYRAILRDLAERIPLVRPFVAADLLANP